MYMFSLKTMKTNITIVQSVQVWIQTLFLLPSRVSKDMEVPGVPVHVSLKHPFMTFTSRMQRQKGLSTLSVTRMVVRIIPFS